MAEFLLLNFRKSPWLFILNVITLLRYSSSATVLSSTTLETCLRNDGGANTNNNNINGSSVLSSSSTKSENIDESCASRVVVLVTLDGGTLGSTSELQFGIPCVGSADGSCPCKCNYAEDSGCECRDLGASVSIRMSRTAVLAEYPLTYVASYNSKMTEVNTIFTILLLAMMMIRR